jgi:oligopeptide transport system substrate-binding protein
MMVPPFASFRRRASLRLVHLLVLALLVFGSGCHRASNVERGNREQILHRGIGPALAGLDPHLATGLTEYNVIAALFEGLVGEDPVDLSPVPGVAERWDISPDGRTYTFHLRRDARWSNGDPVTAQDFIASWRRVLTPSLAADYANLLYVIAGAEAYHKRHTADFSTVGLKSPDPHVLRVTLEYPMAHFLSLLQHWMWFPVHLGSIEAVGSPYDRSTAWARAGSLVGNGAFMLSEWRAEQRVVAQRNPHYWDAANVRLQGIHFHPFEGVDAEERAFRAGQVHLTDAIPLSKIDTYRRQSPELLRIDPFLGTYFFRINVRRPFLNEVKVRRALALAIDRKALVEQVLRAGQLPAAGFVPPGMNGYTSPATLGTDGVAARQLLAEAGYPEGRGAPVVELLFNTSENHRIIAEAIQQMWRQELGLRVTLHNMENRSVLEARRAGDYQVLRSVWVADYMDPATFLDVWRSDSGNNYTGWANPDYDRLLFQAARAGSSEERRALLQRAESLLLEEAPMIPVYYFTHAFLVHPAVRGWHQNVLDRPVYKHVYLEPAGR